MKRVLEIMRPQRGTGSASLDPPQTTPLRRGVLTVLVSGSVGGFLVLAALASRLLGISDAPARVVSPPDAAAAPASTKPAVRIRSSTPLEAIPGRVLLIAAGSVTGPYGAMMETGQADVDGVSRVADAKTALTDATGIVMIHTSAVDVIDWAWVRALFEEGRVIVGLDVNIGELLNRLGPEAEHLVGDEGLGWHYSTESSNLWAPPQHFFSILAGSRIASPCARGYYGMFDDTELLLQALKGPLSCAAPRFTGRSSP